MPYVCGMNKQSSIEWFAEQVDEMVPYIDKLTALKYKATLEQARAMHKEEIGCAFGNGNLQGEMDASIKLEKLDVAELDNIIDDFNANKINLQQLVTLVWNKGYMEGFHEGVCN